MQRAKVMAVGGGLVALLVALGLFLLWPGEETPVPPTVEPEPTPSAEPTPEPATSEPAIDPRCRGGATEPFVPESITVAEVLERAEVMALPRDSANVPQVPPTNAKQAFAWDEPGVRPGSEQGNVLMNTHLWPDGTAAGNALLDNLAVGDLIVLRGAGKKLCYEVTEEVEVRAEDGYPPYYDVDGPPQLALLTCSGERRGPGDWSHRTIWFARPVV